jgi:predicted O-methyltransferase YrrM
MTREEVLRSIEEMASRRSGLPILGPRKGKLLADTMRAKRPKRVLGVGTLIGYSAILMSEHLAPGGRITCVEVSKSNAETAKKNFAEAGVAHRIDVVVGPGTEMIPKLAALKLGGPYDLMFIDAAKDEYLDYLKAAEPILAADAVVVADNVGYFKDDVAEYLAYVRKGGRYRSENHPIGGDAVEVSVRIA